MTKKKFYTIKTKYGDFSVAIWCDRQDKVYLVETKEFDKTMTFGKSLAEAKKMAIELIELLVECAKDEGKIVVDEKMRVLGQRVRPGPLQLA
jgi:predicted RNase H-like HicB family nuclease